MTIESNLASIAKSLELIAVALSSKTYQTVPKQVAVDIDPVVTPVAPIAAIPTPTFMLAATPVATATPFATHAGYVEYVMASYKELGPVKGAGIQAVLQSVGVKNINETKPEMYAQIKAGIDALKG